MAEFGYLTYKTCHRAKNMA